MLIAVTSSNGIDINQHFGHARRFLVYSVESGRLRLVNEVTTDAYCDWGTLSPELSQEEFDAQVAQLRECADAPPSHHLMPDKLSSTAASLGDCRVIVTAMIGEAPQTALEAMGFSIFAINGQIEPTLTEIAKLL